MSIQNDFKETRLTTSNPLNMLDEYVPEPKAWETTFTDNEVKITQVAREGLKSLPIGKVKMFLIIRDHPSCYTYINTYLFYSLVITSEKEKISDLFSSQDRTYKAIAENKLLDIRAFEGLKKDGVEFINGRNIQAQLSFPEQYGKARKYNGLLYYVATQSNFVDYDHFKKVKEKVKAAQNLFMVYESVDKDQRQLNVIICFDNTGIGVNSTPEAPNPLDGYEPRWKIYGEYLNTLVGSDLFTDRCQLTITLYHDPIAYVNYSKGSFVKWALFEQQLAQQQKT